MRRRRFGGGGGGGGHSKATRGTEVKGTGVHRNRRGGGEGGGDWRTCREWGGGLGGKSTSESGRDGSLMGLLGKVDDFRRRSQSPLQAAMQIM